MDSDGEDSPQDVPRLLSQCNDEGGRKVIFAKRAKRSESWIFRCCYQIYKLLYRLLTKQSVCMGNFSVVPRSCLRRIVVAPELWSHFAATVVSSKTPFSLIPTKRAKRVDGQSKMNFVSLVMHGLSSIAVFSDVLGVRLLMATLLLILGDGVGIACIAFLKFFTDLSIPGWASFVTGILLVILLQAVMFSVMFSFLVLNKRREATFVPSRDFTLYVDKCITISKGIADDVARIYRIGA